jgi:voltage-gated potassium channel
MKVKSAHPFKFPLARRLARVLVIALVFIFFFGAIIVPFEIDDPNSKIHNFFDGVWWATTTVTTVGYGDIVPVTWGGRVVGIILQLTGAALFFGVLLGTVTLFINHTQEAHRWKRLDEKLDRLEADNKTLKNKLDFLVRHQQTTAKKPHPWGL